MQVRINDHTYPLDPGKLTFGEAIQIEEQLDATFTEFGKLLRAGSMKAMRAYALVLLQRTDAQARVATINEMGIDKLEFIQDESADEDETPAPVEEVEDPTPAA